MPDTVTDQTAGAKPVRAGLVGCGMIAGRYVKSLEPYPQIELVGVADQAPERSVSFAEKHGVPAYESVAALLADDSIELVLDMSSQDAHAEVVAKCLEAGKHVYCEKPLALEYAQAERLVARAKEKGLRLASAPITFMGEAQQTAAQWVREGRLGTVRVVYAEINHGRIEAWHPSPLPFYECGVLFDTGPYPLVLLTSIFGPAERVHAFGRVLLPDRQTRDGTAFSLEKPDFVVALIQFRSGPVARLTICYYADMFKKQGEMVEFHGDIGSLCLAHSGRFDAAVEFAEFGQPYVPQSLLREPSGMDPLYRIEWARGIVDMVAALQEGRPHRATGEQAAHIIEIMAGISRAIETEGSIDIKSEFALPAPMDWAR